MKLLSRQDDSLTFEFRPRELEILLRLLGSYPVQNMKERRIARPEHLEKLALEQQMLVESLSEQQEANRQLVASFIDRHLRPKSKSTGEAPVTTITISDAEADWLLEVLNDVRVGCWNRMGCPDEIHLHSWRLAMSHPREFGLMEMASLAQFILLEALDG